MITIEDIKNVDKRILIAVIVVTVLIVLGIYYLYNNDKDSGAEENISAETEDVIKSLTAPSNSYEPISEEVQESLTAPNVEDVQVDEDVLNSLTAPTQWKKYLYQF